MRTAIMGHRFAELAFTPAVCALQEAEGSRAGYAKNEPGDRHHDRLGEREAAFIAARDSFYMATVSETGWPYVQHRGGPAGFLRVLDEKTVGFADFRGNRQYVSLGNLARDDRVSLILMDYANRARLKILGRARTVGLADDPALTARLALSGYRAKVERAMLIAVEAFDWNCPQHITPRFTLDEVNAAAAGLKSRIAELEAELARLTASRVGAETSMADGL
jgi:predicted pyridoxine 5'-phosphate oxidase superfamily flavin-nucleotide-binding protein